MNFLPIDSSFMLVTEGLLSLLLFHNLKTTILKLKGTKPKVDENIATFECCPGRLKVLNGKDPERTQERGPKPLTPRGRQEWIDDQSTTPHMIQQNSSFPCKTIRMSEQFR